MNSTDFFVPFFIIRRLFLLVGQCGNDILSRCPDLAPRRIAEQPPYLRAFSTVIRQLHKLTDFTYEYVPVRTAVRTFNKRNYWYPLPMDEVAALDNLQQNPGW